MAAGFVKKAGHRTGFLLRRCQPYFLSLLSEACGSAAFGNGLSEAAGAGAGGGGGGVPVAPVADEDVLGGGAASAFGASAGAGVGAAGGVGAVVLGAVVLGAVVLGAGAAGGGVTLPPLRRSSGLDYQDRKKLRGRVESDGLVFNGQQSERPWNRCLRGF